MAEVIPIGGRQEDQVERCRALTAKGTPCRNRAGDDGYCAVHRQPIPTASDATPATDALQDILDFVHRRLTGEYHVDEFGFDAELTEEILAPLARFFHERWWRVEWIGMENVPTEGAALLVANHAGTVPWDAVVMKFGVLDHHPAHRHVRLLAADLAFTMPFIGALARKSGNTLAASEDADRLLDKGELLGVFPEGYKGVGKPFSQRYKLQRFGRGGFIELALRARCPIVPVSIVGSEEIYPMIADVKLLARLLGLPYFPVTPLFPLAGPAGMIPLPSKWHIRFGEPIDTTGYEEGAADDPMVTFELTDQVRETIQHTLYQLLAGRRNMFFG